jgi:beta-lactamase class A
MAASIGKLPVLATLYRAAAQGEIDLQEEIPILPEDIRDYGDGKIPDFLAEEYLSLRESAYRMINHSDNVAWSMLDRRLGAERIRNELGENRYRTFVVLRRSLRLLHDPPRPSVLVGEDLRSAVHQRRVVFGDVKRHDRHPP